MVKLVVNDQQAELIASSREEVAVCDQQGRFLGYLARVDSAERVSQMLHRRAIEESTFSTAEVLSHLDAIEPR